MNGVEPLKTTTLPSRSWSRRSSTSGTSGGALARGGPASSTSAIASVRAAR
jgi:hypothetical protein